MRIIAIMQAWDDADGASGAGVWLMHALAERFDRIDIIALRKNPATSTPSNTRIYSLGKRPGDGIIARFGYLFRFHRAMHSSLSEPHQPEAIFTYMSPTISILAWPYAALFGIPVITWFAHARIGLMARVAALCSARIVTAMPESYRAAPSKRIAIGNCVPETLFMPDESAHEPGLIICIGRLAPVKRNELAIMAVAALRQAGVPCRIIFAGGGDRAPLRAEALRFGIAGAVSFMQIVPYRDLPPLYRRAAVTVNCSPYGSYDKTVLESCMCGVPCVVMNGLFSGCLGSHAATLVAKDGDVADFACRLGAALALFAGERRAMGRDLRSSVVALHGMEGFAKRLAEAIASVPR